MKKFIYPVLLILFIAIVQSCFDNKKSKNYNEKTLIDQGAMDFVLTGIESGQTEIKAATVAESNSKNPRVIRFAKMMIEDHTNVGNQLKKIEAQKLVTSTDSISQDHQLMINALLKKTGTDCDKSYMQMMVTDHEEAVKLFADASENKNQTIQNFAKKIFPKIKMHLDSARAINASLK